MNYPQQGFNQGYQRKPLQPGTGKVWPNKKQRPGKRDPELTGKIVIPPGLPPGEYFLNIWNNYNQQNGQFTGQFVKIGNPVQNQQQVSQWQQPTPNTTVQQTYQQPPQQEVQVSAPNPGVTNAAPAGTTAPGQPNSAAPTAYNNPQPVQNQVQTQGMPPAAEDNLPF